MNIGEANFIIQQILKRVLDILVSALGLILLFPIMVIIALAIKVESKGPVIFRHKRVGKGCKPFDLYKFRSMVRGGDDKGYMQYLHELIESERNGSSHGLPYCKMKIDSRVTRVGRFLRNYYLDELPQLLNILKGDMSLVGPRPHVQFEVDHYTLEQCRRLTVKPGATGLWQVAGKGDCTFNELISLDLEYIDRWSLWLDTKILFQTIFLILRGGEKIWARMSKHIPGRGQFKEASLPQEQEEPLMHPMDEKVRHKPVKVKL